MKSGKNQADRQRLKELYKSMVVHFQKIKEGLESYTPKTWTSYNDKMGVSDPLIKKMIKNGDIIEINNKIARKAEDIEKQALALGWRFYNIYKDIHEISLATVNKYISTYHEPNGNNFCTKKPGDSTGRSYTKCKIGHLLDKKSIDEKLSYLQNNPNLGINFEHIQDSRIIYSITIYPDDLVGISIKDLLYEINDSIITNVENANSLLEEKEEVCKNVDCIIKMSTKRAKDPHTFVETIGGAFLDIFKI